MTRVDKLLDEVKAMKHRYKAVTVCFMDGTHRELSRRGGIASGARRRYLADLRLSMVETLAGADLARETREEYRQAVLRYVKEERKKAARLKRPKEKS